MQEGVAVVVEVIGAALMIDLPSQIVVFVSNLVQLLTQILDLAVKTLPHPLQTLLLLLLASYALLHGLDLLNRRKGTCLSACLS